MVSVFSNVGANIEPVWMCDFQGTTYSGPDWLPKGEVLNIVVDIDMET